MVKVLSLDNLKIYILDKTNNLLGFVKDNKLFDLKGQFIQDVKPETTIKQLKDILLNQTLRLK